MALMDEFKEERDKIKNAPFKEKFNYYWGYYKFHAFAVIFGLIFLFVIIRDVTRKQETYLFVAILNCLETSSENAESFLNDYIDYAELEVDKDNYVLFDSSMTLTDMAQNEAEMASNQRMLVYTSTGQIDVILTGSDIFAEYANGEMFYDLRDLLTPDQIEKYSQYFYYVDKSVVEILNSDAAIYNEDGYEEPEIPDPAAPEEMEEPIPVGLFVTDCQKLKDSYAFIGDEYIAMGFMLNSQRLDNLLKFIDYIYE